MKKLIGYGYCFWYEDGDLSSIPFKAKKQGLDFAEVSLTYPWPDQISKKDVLQTIKNISNSGIQFGFHGPLEGLFLYNVRSEIVNAAFKIHKKCLEFSSSFDPLYYNFHIKADANTLYISKRAPKSRDTAHRRCLKALDKMLKISKELGIKLIIENSSWTSYLIPIQELLCRELDFNLDVGHWFRGDRGYDELSELVDTIGKRIVLIHLHDTKLDESREDHLSIGDGKIDFNKVFDILRNVKYEWITLETMPSKTNIIQENLTKAKELVLNTKLL